ncbi:MAG TPA: hydrogen peroxide-inducible genes activator [Burkholderiaceae bacterium]|nr:hydrogen peroxide-inducible genes activator [Burkholderiaceae bacterium]
MATLSTANALSLRQLAYLVALSETLNFTRAAERCFVTQSTLSVGIRELEQTLSVVLFERDRQSVRVTPIGQELVERARSLLSQSLDLVNTAQAAGNPLQGTVTLGAIPTIAPFLLPRLLRLMRRDMPDLTTLLREDQTAALLHAVEEGEIDFAIIALPMDVGRLRVYPVFTEELWLIASENDPMAKLVHPKVSQLDMPRLLLLSDGHCLREHTLQACQSGRRGRDRIPSTIVASSLPTLVQMVEAGLGVSLLPEMAIKAGFLVGTNVIARPLAAPSPQREIVLVARPTTPRGELLVRIQQLAVSIGTGAAPIGPKRSRVKRVPG